MLTLFALLTPNVCSVFNIRFFGRPLTVGKLWECQMEFLSMGKDHTDTTSRLFQMALIMRPLMLIQVKFLNCSAFPFTWELFLSACCFCAVLTVYQRSESVNFGVFRTYISMYPLPSFK